MESSEWPVVGILAGVTDYLGHWSQCLKVKRPTFRGKYCLVKTSMELPTENKEGFILSHDSNIDNLDESTAWDFMEMCNYNQKRIIRNRLKWAMCMPSSCSPADLELSLNNVICPIFRRNFINITVTVDPILCKTKEDVHEYPHWYYHTRSLLYSLLILVVFATFFDYTLLGSTDTNSQLSTRIFTSFSVRRTCKNLVQYEPSTTISFIYSLKTIGILSVLIAHRQMLTYNFPFFQIEDIEMLQNQARLHSIHFLDGFFMISGFLMYHYAINPTKTIGAKYILIYVIVRYLKLIPAYGLVLLFTTNILPHMGEGPLWIPYWNLMFGPCRKSWWINLLGFNNFQIVEDKCYLPTWHLAVDFQLSLIGGLLVLILSKSKKLGIVFMMALFLIGNAISTAAAYSLNFNGFFIFTIRIFKDFRNKRTQYYSATYPRITSYLMGFTVGMVVSEFKKKKKKFSEMQAYSLLLLSILLAYCTTQYGNQQTQDSSVVLSIMDIVQALIYRMLSLMIFACLLCIYAVGISNFNSKIMKFLYDIGELKIFVPIGRLVYCTFLISLVYQVYHVYTQLRPINTSSSSIDFFLWHIADIIISPVLAFILYILSDGPVSNILNILKTLIDNSMKRKSEKEEN